MYNKGDGQQINSSRVSTCRRSAFTRGDGGETAACGAFGGGGGDVQANTTTTTVTTTIINNSTTTTDNTTTNYSVDADAAAVFFFFFFFPDLYLLKISRLPYVPDTRDPAKLLRVPAPPPPLP